MDMNGWTQGEHRYQNLLLLGGDMLVAVDQHDVRHAALEEIKRLLKGPPPPLAFTTPCASRLASSEGTAP
jgi:hypothetical protein